MTRLAAVAVAAFVSISLGNSARGEDPKITYDDQIQPLLREKCFGCHNQDKTSGGLNLTTYPSLMAGGGSGEPISPGDPDTSYLYQLVTHESEPTMPPNSDKLPQEQLDLIKAWILGGALQNSGSTPVASNKPKFSLALDAAATGKPEGPPPMPGKLPLEPVVQTARTTAVTALAASPWAPLVAVAGQKQVLLYNSDSYEFLGVLPFPEGVPQVLKFSRNGSLLLAGGGHGAKAGRVVVFSVTTGERIFEVGSEFDSVLAADISSDQKLIALGGPSKVVRVFSTADGSLVHEIKKHTDWIYTLEFSPDGVLLASGDRNGGLLVWEAHTGRAYLDLRGHSGSIADVAWTPDSNLLASASEDSTIRYWEMENGGQVKGFGAHGNGVQSIDFANDGRLVSCGRDNTTKLWDANAALQRDFPAFSDLALQAELTHDGARVIAGDWTGEIRVWSSADGAQLATLSSNPPTLAQRVSESQAALAQAQAAAEPLAQAVAAAQAAADKAPADLATAKSAIDAATAEHAKANELATAKQQAFDSASAALSGSTNQIAARQELSKELAEAAAKAQEAAAKLPDDAALAETAAALKAQLDKVVAETQGLDAKIAEQKPFVDSATAELAAAQPAMTQAAQTLDAANKQVEALAPVAQASADALAAAQVALAPAQQAVAAAAAAVDKWTAEVAQLAAVPPAAM